MSFLYGNHVLKSGLGRITDNTPAYAGVVVCSMSDIPLGFATTAKSTLDCRKLDPSGIVAFHQADTGMYLRDEGSLCGAPWAFFAEAHFLACSGDGWRKGRLMYP